MRSYILKQIHQAREARRGTQLPAPARIISLSMVLTLAYIGLSIVLVPSDLPREFHFVDETGAITGMSAMYLALSCGLSLSSGILYQRRGDGSFKFWFMMFFVFGYLAMDELIQFHERGGSLLHYAGFSSGIFRNWNDIIVIAYGVAALLGILIFLPVVLRFPMVLELYITAFIFYALHTIIDSMADPPTVYSVITEESFKLICVQFLALGSLMGFLGFVWNHTFTRSER